MPIFIPMFPHSLPDGQIRRTKCQSSAPRLHLRFAAPPDLLQIPDTVVDPCAVTRKWERGLPAHTCPNPPTPSTPPPSTPCGQLKMACLIIPACYFPVVTCCSFEARPPSGSQGPNFVGQPSLLSTLTTQRSRLWALTPCYHGTLHPLLLQPGLAYRCGCGVVRSRAAAIPAMRSLCGPRCFALQSFQKETGAPAFSQGTMLLLLLLHAREAHPRMPAASQMAFAPWVATCGPVCFILLLRDAKKLLLLGMPNLPACIRHLPCMLATQCLGSKP